jgi:hypothetical protein
MLVRNFVRAAGAAAALLAAGLGSAQDFAQPTTLATDAPVSPSQKRQYFLDESFTLWALLPSTVTAAQAVITHTDPQYGPGAQGYFKAYGALTADRFTQKFFSDYAMASVFHEDPRYHRKGPGYGFWTRAAYAITRAVVTRTDTGGNTANWANFVGTAFSAAVSNIYYPQASRGGRSTAVNWGTSAASIGFADLRPEFLPDVKAWFKRHHL